MVSLSTVDIKSWFFSKPRLFPDAEQAQWSGVPCGKMGMMMMVMVVVVVMVMVVVVVVVVVIIQAKNWLEMGVMQQDF